MVFLHALLPGATGRSIEAVATSLVTQLPIRVVGIDAPGFGGSAPLDDDEYDLDRLAHRLGEAAVDAAAGPFVVAGHSWGAALAVRIAAARPDHVLGVVLLDGGHFDHADLSESDPEETVDQTLAEMADFGWGRTPAGEWRATSSPRAAAAAMNALMRGRSSASYAAMAAAGMPVLLLTATEPEQRRRDNEARTRQLATALPRLTTHALPDAGHDVVREAPDLVAERIAAWWADVL
jgi:pimeloyl-ACP methyl ester carboxylesterase